MRNFLFFVILFLSSCVSGAISVSLDKKDGFKKSKGYSLTKVSNTKNKRFNKKPVNKYLYNFICLISVFSVVILCLLCEMCYNAYTVNSLVSCAQKKYSDVEDSIKKFDVSLHQECFNVNVLPSKRKYNSYVFVVKEYNDTLKDTNIGSLYYAYNWMLRGYYARFLYNAALKFEKRWRAYSVKFLS